MKLIEGQLSLNELRKPLRQENAASLVAKIAELLDTHTSKESFIGI